jgi:nucleotide-binding universal stress UspA family protein
MKIARILVATDFSPASERALEVAAHWARTEKAALHVIHVAPPKSLLGESWGVPSTATRGIYRQATEALHALVGQIDPSHELAITTGLRMGRAGRRILEAARDFSADLLVLGARGEHENNNHRGALGGTSSRVAHSTTIPLLLVRKPVAEQPVAVAAVDLGPQSRRIVLWAAKAARGGHIYVFHAYEVPYGQRLSAYGLAPETVAVYTQDERMRRENELSALCAFAPMNTTMQFAIERGEPVRETLRHAERVQANLIVVGKHNLSTPGLRSPPYGSVCRSIASFAQTDVLVIPPE